MTDRRLILPLQILCSVDPKRIPRLSSCDDEIYAKFKECFPDFKLDKVKEEELKSEEAKKVDLVSPRQQID